MSIIKKKAKDLIKKSLVRVGYHATPAFIIIGAQKAGTSALFSMLKQHPQVVAAQRKEMHFFDGGLMRFGDFSAYHEFFPLPYELYPDKLTFEASPSYLYHPECPHRIYEYSRSMKLIAILRNPVARAFSAWNMYHRFQHSANPYHRSLADARSFEEAVAQEIKNLDQTSWMTNRMAYVKRGIYIEQLERFFCYFSEEAVLVLEHNELLNAPEATLKQICRFLQVDDQFAFEIMRANISTYETKIPAKIYDTLNALYMPYNQKLFAFLGREFDW